jgi:hypothetical protein
LINASKCLTTKAKAAQKIEEKNPRNHARMRKIATFDLRWLDKILIFHL